MAVVALKDVLQAFDVEDIPSEEEMQTKLAADMKQLLKCQVCQFLCGLLRK